ncbi:hypothetical protein PVK06_042574 [Gossypium arboreum]|uniref:Uncharacterized protein n=1 Tax=Gossypium arboreum TaxID=29729 RepID=A0ABR0ML51_GOSAR|nr:hypothetical protein PVK06_042574 [Gossypium arboreum]
MYSPEPSCFQTITSSELPPEIGIAKIRAAVSSSTIFSTSTLFQLRVILDIDTSTTSNPPHNPFRYQLPSAADTSPGKRKVRTNFRR